MMDFESVPKLRLPFNGQEVIDSLGRIVNREIDAIADQAQNSAERAEQSAASALQSARTARELRDSIQIDSEQIHRELLVSKSWAVGNTGVRDGEDIDNSKYYSEQSRRSADLAQSYAESMTIPAAENVYNIIVQDRVTGDKYALLVENGIINLLSVSEGVTVTALNMVDVVTGTAYTPIVEDGVLKIEEV